MLRPALALVTVAFALSILTSADAAAAAQRTFVASYGNDASPCSLTLPCRGFAAAVSQTNAGGEVIVLDSAGYGTVTIAQSVSIIAPPGVYAGITVPTGASGVAVDGPAINVALRGLSINGSAGSVAGIRMYNGSSLAVENCTISGAYAGVSVETAASLNIAGVAIKNSIVGISVGIGAVASITNTQIASSSLYAIQTAVAPANGTTTNIFVTDTVITGAAYCLINNLGNISATRVTATGCLFAVVNDSAGSVTVSDSMISGNQYGFVQWTEGVGVFQSLGNNHLSGNVTDTFGTITIIGGK